MSLKFKVLNKLKLNFNYIKNFKAQFLKSFLLPPAHLHSWRCLLPCQEAHPPRLLISQAPAHKGSLDQRQPNLIPVPSECPAHWVCTFLLAQYVACLLF